MKKLLLFSLLFMFSCVTTFAQINEPEFIGEVNLVDNTNGKTTLLDKEAVKVKSKMGASVYLVGIGSIKTRITIGTPAALARVKASDKFNLIVKCVDNASDPISVIDVFQFDKKKKQRRAEISSANTFGGSSSGNLKHIKFQAKKYGESSYILTMPTITPGEYGIIVKNPNNLDEKSVIVACFGVDE